LKPLAEIEAVSRQDYTDALAAAREATAAVARAQAQLQTASINLGLTDIPAPISGRIGRSVVTTGALVAANQTTALTTIQRLDPMFVDMQQSSAELLALRRALSAGNVAPVQSAPVQLELEDGSRYAHAGTLQFAESLVDPATGSVTLRARFANPDALLLPGMFVRARLVQATAQDAILVPQQAVLRDARGQASVMLVGTDGKAVQRDIRTERTVGDQWLVVGGLQAGDRVVVEGLQRIKPGQPVRAVTAGAAGAARAASAPQNGASAAAATPLRP
jgi:membrane fusion protein, multidrug efflux system